MKIRFYLLSLVFLLIIFSQCTKDKGKVSDGFNDAYLYTIAKDTTGKFSYKDASNLSEFNSVVGDHGNKPYTLYMNKKANDACTASGKLPSGGTFPDSSLLVKYLKTSAGGPLDQLIVMYKRKGSWVWAEYKPNGDVIWSYKQDAALCLGCHTATPRDHTATFDVHP